MPSRRYQRRTPKRDPKRALPYSERNWRLFGLGLGVIALGYVFLSRPPVGWLFVAHAGAPVARARLLRLDPHGFAQGREEGGIGNRFAIEISRGG